MTKHNPTELDYTLLEPGNAPRYGVSGNQSKDFQIGSRDVYVWFVHLEHATFWKVLKGGVLWDLENGIVI